MRAQPAVKSPRGTRRRPKAAGPTKSELAANLRLANFCRALAQPVRVRILRLLLREQCMFGDLSRRIPLAASTISQHLKVLAEAGLVESEAIAQCTCYCVNKSKVAELKKMLAGL